MGRIQKKDADWLLKQNINQSQPFTEACIWVDSSFSNHQPIQAQTPRISVHGAAPGPSLEDAGAPDQDTIAASTQEVMDQHPSMGDDVEKSETNPANHERDAGLHVETRNQDMGNSDDQPEDTQPPKPTQQQVPEEQSRLPDDGTHRGKGVGQGQPLPLGNGGKGGFKRGPEEDEFYTESEPPPPLSRSAIDGRLRRVFKKRKDGSYVVDQQWVDMFNDSLGSGRDEVMAMFEKVAYDRDRGRPNMVAHTCRIVKP